MEAHIHWLYVALYLLVMGQVAVVGFFLEKIKVTNELLQSISYQLEELGSDLRSVDSSVRSLERPTISDDFY